MQKALLLAVLLPSTVSGARFLGSVNVASNQTTTGCGPMTTYPNAKPSSFANQRKTKYDESANKTVDVTFSAGDITEFKCDPGFTTDGSKDGNNTFDVNCSDGGYYKPTGACLEASKCGAVPNITNAIPGQSKNGAVEMKCLDGYSLDGEKVVPGGMGKNQLFTLKCIEFNNKYEDFKGECTPYAFVPASEGIRIYNKVFEALFVVSCKGTLKKSFGKDGEPPAGLDNACAKITDSAVSAQCDGLVTSIKADFSTQWSAREAHDGGAGKEWFEEKNATRPGITTKATKFCEDLWALLEVTPP